MLKLSPWAGVALLLLAFAAAAFPQTVGTPPTRAEIHGVVAEAATGAPVPGATVDLDFYGPTQPNLMPSPPKSTESTEADAAGVFSFNLETTGYYGIRVSKEGYRGLGKTAGGLPSERYLTLTDKAPSVQTTLYLSKPGSLAGRLVDGETGKPLAGVRVSVFGSAGRTDKDGEFSVKGLAPGEYVAAIGPQAVSKDRVRASFTEDDFKAVDEDFEQTFWPGGHGRESALPVLLGPGADRHIGELKLSKIPYYRVLLRMPPASCGPENDLNITEFIQLPGGGWTFQPLSSAACAKGILVTGFAPGAHRLILSVSNPDPDDALTGSVPFTITDRNVELTVSLSRGVELNGAFVAADGAKPPDFTKLRLMARPIGADGSMRQGPPTAPDDDGKFRLSGVLSVDSVLMIRGAGPSHYVKEIRYNGALVANDTLPLGLPSAAHDVTVVLDDKPASVTGVVMSGDKPVDKPAVILKKWPPAGGGLLEVGVLAARGDAQGRFQLSGIPPGQYRALALRSATVTKYLNSPGDRGQEAVLFGAMEGSKIIELGPNARVTVTLEAFEPK
jgi:hypothetical protein